MTLLSQPILGGGSGAFFGPEEPGAPSEIEERTGAAALASIPASAAAAARGVEPENLDERLRSDMAHESKLLGLTRVCLTLSRADLSKIRDVSLIFEVIQFIEAHTNDSLDQLDIQDLFNELAKRPFSFDLIEGIVRRRGAPISPAERRLMRQIARRFPDLNRTLASWELLQRETDRMGLDLALGESRFPKTVIRIGGEVFPANDISGSPFRMLVHAAGPHEGPIETVKEWRREDGFMCCSLLSDETPDFYEQNKNYAMVLSADPTVITATTREDAYTPYRAEESPKQFYRFYQRLQLLTAFIDRLYRESGIQGDHPTDEHSTLNRLMSSRDQGSSVEPMIDELTKALRKGRSALELYAIYNEGLSRQKLKELERAPCLQGKIQREEFLRCGSLLEDIKSDDSVFSRHIHPIQPPEELLRQTPFQSPHVFNLFGERPFNEVNLYLGGPDGKDAVTVRAILVDRNALEKNPQAYLSLLVNARECRIPILVKKDPVLTPEAIKYRLIRAVESANCRWVERLLASGAIDAATAQKAFEVAVENMDSKIISSILKTGLISDALIAEGFERLIGEGFGQAASAILDFRPGLLQRRALEILSGEWPSTSCAFLCLSLHEQGIDVPESISYKAFSFFAASRHWQIELEALFRKCKKKLSVEERRKWIECLWNHNSSGLPFIVEEIDAEWLFSRLMEKGSYETFHVFSRMASFLAALSPKLAERAFLYASEYCLPLGVACFLERDPPLSDRVVLDAFLHYPQAFLYSLPVLISRRAELVQENGQEMVEVLPADDRKIFFQELAEEKMVPASLANEAFSALIDCRRFELAYDVYMMHHELFTDQEIIRILAPFPDSSLIPGLQVIYSGALLRDNAAAQPNF